jgi:ABC-type Fe3+-hydroxamate transport system substrate-binding protein
VRTVYYTPGGTTVGPYSQMVASLIYGCGATNLVKTAGVGKDDRIPLSVEQLAALEPDAIVFGEPDTAPPGFRERLLADPRLAGTPAIQHGRVYEFDVWAYGDRLRSHRVMDAVADLHRLLYSSES